MFEVHNFPPPIDDHPEVPWPLDSPEVGETIRRLYTQDLKDAGVAGTVSVSVDVDEYGSVIDSRAVSPEPLPPNEHVFEVMASLDGQSWTPPPRSNDSRLQRIAEEAARVQRFRPALQQGVPVRFEDFRMSYVLGRHS
jgi:hypothetical protein